MGSPGDALNSAIAHLPPDARLGVAVSGGGDSVALLVLAVERLGAGRVQAATVDHGLRPEAAGEAAQVAALCEGLGLRHDVLRWDGGPGRGNLMARARAARFRLLAGWAQRADLDAVALGHTLDDQAETLLMRLTRGSGVDGLAAMAPRFRRSRVVWLRPFLGVSRADLRMELTGRGVTWAEDPSNADPRFTRSRARAAMAALAPLGIDAAGLAATAARMTRARAVLEGQARLAFEAFLNEASGTVVIDNAALGLEPEIRDRLFAAAIMGLTGSDYRPRLAALHRALRAVEQRGGRACLGGVAFEAEAQGVRLWREAAAVTGHRVPVGAVWDRRWRAWPAAALNEHDRHSVEIAALGRHGLMVLSRQARDGLHRHWRGLGLPRQALEGLPAIWRGQSLMAAPLAFWPQGWRLDARPLAAPGGHEGEFD